MNAAEAVSNCESSGGETDADRNTPGLSRLGGIGGGNLSSASHTHNITHDYTFLSRILLFIVAMMMIVIVMFTWQVHQYPLSQLLILTS